MVEDTTKKPPMSWEGVGPLMALCWSPFLAGAIAVRLFAPPLASFGFDGARSVLGWSWTGLGALFWAWTAVYFLRRFFSGELITGGPFAWSRNPIYASVIVFVVPGLALVWDAWPLLVADVALYLVFRRFIGREYAALARAFGSEYRRYEARVPELFPLPPFLRGA
jgi:protein-S-isoprenylcysteine O-methyltransferase Ste14